jgi:hypothetical protein
VQLSVTNQGVSRLTRLAAFQRPINDALFGLLTRDEFRLLTQLLARLAANGDGAVKLAEHIGAKMKLDAAPVVTERRRKQSLASRAKR